jgi:hypothetical protein
MGDLSKQTDTFWQLLHAAPGSSRWSLVTPPGVADNGGLVAGASAGSIVVAVLPSRLLRFSPLAQSNDGGRSWNPVFLPGVVAARPDALAVPLTPAGGATAVVTGGGALVASKSLSSWSPLVMATGLARVSPGCGVTALDAVAIVPGGDPAVATGCRRGGEVGVFTRTGGEWQSDGITLDGSLRGSSTEVLRLQVTGSTTTALVSARRAGRTALVALWRTGAAPWTASSPLPLGATSGVLSTSVGTDGALAVLLGARGRRPVAYHAVAGGAWLPLPLPPPSTTALSFTPGTGDLGASGVAAFTVHGESLGVFALTPAGSRWVRVQSSRIPLAYGSSG